MHTHILQSEAKSLKAARAAGEAARRRRALMTELSAMFSGGIMVAAGLVLAALYCLLTHQISN